MSIRIKPPNYRMLYYGVLIASLVSGIPLRSVSQPLSANKDKYIGAATSSYVYRDFNKYWNQISPGNDGKWGSVEYVRGVYNWTNLDKIYTYAVNTGLLYKHHTLVWGNQQPSWIAALDSTAQRSAVEKWIQQVGARYTNLAMVDVVNEPFHAPPSYKQALGGDGATGWDWVITAFEMARKYCVPGAKLLLNEYNILADNTVTTNYINLITLLKARGLIDGIGVQGHYFEFRSSTGAAGGYVYDIPTIKTNLARLTATGLPVYITEFDINEPVDANQLAQYKIYFPVFWNNRGVKGITLWGYIQGDVWSSYPDTYLLLSDGRERPALAWLRAYVATPLIPVPLYPVGVKDVDDHPRIVWQRSDSATAYRMQVSLNRMFQTMMIDSVVSDTTFQLSKLDAGTTYYWRVAASNTYGTSEFSATSGFTTISQATASGQEKAQPLPVEFSVRQNYPNPFNPSTVIAYTLPKPAQVRIQVFDPLGRECARLLDAMQPAGLHVQRLEAAGTWPSGMYYYRVEAGGKSVVKTMLLMK